MASRAESSLRSWIGRICLTILAVSLVIIIGLYELLSYSWSDKTYDVTSEMASRGGYSRNAEFTLKQDVLAYRTGGVKPPLNPSIAEFQQHPEKWDYLVLMPAGTRIRVTKVERLKSFEYSRDDAFGVPLDGPLAGKEMNLDGLSNGIGVVGPNPEYLAAAGR